MWNLFSAAIFSWWFDGENMVKYFSHIYYSVMYWPFFHNHQNLQLYILSAFLELFIVTCNITMGDFGDNSWQHTYQVNPLFSVVCAYAELRKQWTFTLKVCFPQAFQSLPFDLIYILTSILFQLASQEEIEPCVSYDTLTALSCTTSKSLLFVVVITFSHCSTCIFILLTYKLHI